MLAAVLPWWPLRLAASIPGGLVLVRAFIISHEYMHGSLLRGSRLAGGVLYTLGLLMLTPPRHLPEAMTAIPELQHPPVTSLRLRDILSCFRANLWDTRSQRMVSYRDATASTEERSC